MRVVVTDSENMKRSYAGLPPAQGLYDPANEHDSCGVGFIASIKGTPSHSIVRDSVEILKNLLHRGAVGGDLTTGDGAGILIQVPDKFFRTEADRLGFELPVRGSYGVGMVFMPRSAARKSCIAVVEKVVRDEGLMCLGWREVPTDDRGLGEVARRDQPHVMQVFIDGIGFSGGALDRKLLIVRKQVQRKVREILKPGDRFYLPSLSSRTVVYKGLLMGGQVSGFYTELANPAVESAVAVLHQRYSTNTFPSWELSQPFRFLAHNGEINTLRGNLNQMRAREQRMESPLFGEDLRKVFPVIDPEGSDSACLDNALEMLVAGGRSLPHAMMMLIPEAWGAKYPMGPDQKGFFEYHAGLMEPWDGPATVAFTDGEVAGTLLDRNGLRPARYTLTRDGVIIMASEAGVLDIAPERVLEKGALRPGQMLLVDLKQGRVIKDKEIKSQMSRRQPYRRWVEENKVMVQGLFEAVATVTPDRELLLRKERLFGYTREDIQMILEPLASKAHEAVGSMGSDTPLAVFSEKPQLLFSYFKQMFAQVTNPPIDPIREELVMSLMTFIGNPSNILTEIPQHARLIKLMHPILANDDLDRIRNLELPDFAAQTVSIGFKAKGTATDLEGSLERVCDEAEEALRRGRNLIILSDRDLPRDQAPIPALLAVSAVNRRLIRAGCRTGAGLIMETGEAREVMHMALLLGYGATAINPYLAFEIVADMALQRELSVEIGVSKALDNYVAALGEGLRKVMSKMGISTLRSYRSSQVFEAIGLSREVVDRYFEGTSSRIDGIGLDVIAAEANARYEAAWETPPEAPALLTAGGHYRYRSDGERHLWSPEAISKLQQATRTGDYKLYREYARLINDQAEKQFTLRGMFRFKGAKAVPIGDVEPASAIVKRFVTGAMSYGSISREAHETMAIAMNRLGGKSNSGEGGEDPARYKPLPNGDSRCSAIKQVASGRFGVTAEYCVNSRELQIKIAQGAKPGEGGQLPGHKVNEEIGRVRHATPGVTLISPPPHHDIYSIEDIKQLIYDLKNINPEARVSVKLVSELGVGTIAAGVAKAKADMILISGWDGGTGASPLSSIRHAGAPWELGLAETQQTLVLNNLRGRVRLQADGQIKTGRDVVVAALLGAEEFGFATTALVVMGCVMMRKCHHNTCPVGVATQDPALRKLFTGKPEFLERFFMFIAEETRETMAELGIRTMDELVGRSDLLEMNDAITFWKSRGLDVSKILYRPESSGPVRCVDTQSHDLDQALDLVLLPKVEKAIVTGKPVQVEYAIRNVNRTVGTMIAGRVARQHGHAGLPDNTITLAFRGAAGQSFGAWCARGMTMILEGEANDYVGKGLSGGRIILKPYAKAQYIPSENILAGNVLLYGATCGEIYIHGMAGERFAIRNSGAHAVVEGVGDHGCEYMTGGRVVVLGRTGVNFGAGMSGGLAYIYDEDRNFDRRCNLDMVDLELVIEPRDQDELRGMLEKHVAYTGSLKATKILADWQEHLPYFIKVFPMEYRRVLGKMMREDEATKRAEVVHG
jgi:glutamate synthase domain-containing protein 2/glutamate synthase domain-containing protein 1/glutamate synthase domain-containing protein 3